MYPTQQCKVFSKAPALCISHLQAVELTLTTHHVRLPFHSRLQLLTSPHPNRNPQVISPLPCRQWLCPREHQLLQNTGFVFPVPSNTYSFIPERGLHFIKSWLWRFRFPHLRRFPLQVLICQHQRHPPVQSMPQWSHNKQQKSFRHSYSFPRRPKAINTMFFCKEQS